MLSKRRSEPATLLIVDGRPYLIDCGIGTMRRMFDARVQSQMVRTIFITHNHPDHALLRNPNLRAITKAGYYAPDAHAPIDARHQQMIKLAEAVQSTIPLDSLNLSLSGVVRHTDTRTADFTVEVKSKNLRFEPSENGAGIAQLIVAAASLNQYGNILASRTQTVTLVVHSTGPGEAAGRRIAISFHAACAAQNPQSAGNHSSGR